MSALSFVYEMSALSCNLWWDRWCYFAFGFTYSITFSKPFAKSSSHYCNGHNVHSVNCCQTGSRCWLWKCLCRCQLLSVYRFAYCWPALCIVSLCVYLLAHSSSGRIMGQADSLPQGYLSVNMLTSHLIYSAYTLRMGMVSVKSVDLKRDIERIGWCRCLWGPWLHIWWYTYGSRHGDLN